MASCKYCGEPLLPGAKFCTNCGARIVPLDSPARASIPEPVLEDRPVWAFEKTAKAKRRGRILGLVLIILLVAAAVMCLSPGKRAAANDRVRGSVSASAGQRTESELPADFVNDVLPAGSYSLRGFSVGDRHYNNDVIEKAGFDDWYLTFDGESQGEASILGSGQQAFSYDDRSILFEDGAEMSYVLAQDTLTVYGPATMIFYRTDADTPLLLPEEFERASDALPLDSYWHGSLTISEHRGTGILENGTMEIWGYLGSVRGSGYYFELYDAEDIDLEDTTAILSFWTEIDGDRLVPVIGEEDAWLFDIWLDDRDVDAFTLRYEDGSLHTDYRYEAGSESCLVSFSVSPE